MRIDILSFVMIERVKSIRMDKEREKDNRVKLAFETMLHTRNRKDKKNISINGPATKWQMADAICK